MIQTVVVVGGILLAGVGFAVYAYRIPAIASRESREDQEEGDVAWNKARRWLGTLPGRVAEILAAVCLSIMMFAILVVFWVYKGVFATCPRFECTGNMHYDHTYRSPCGKGNVAVHVCDVCGETEERFVSYAELEMLASRGFMGNTAYPW